MDFRRGSRIWGLKFTHDPTILQSSPFVHFFAFIGLVYVDGKNPKAEGEFKK